jgi:hypothetical protein
MSILQFNRYYRRKIHLNRLMESYIIKNSYSPLSFNRRNKSMLMCYTDKSTIIDLLHHKRPAKFPSDLLRTATITIARYLNSKHPGRNRRAPFPIVFILFVISFTSAGLVRTQDIFRPQSFLLSHDSDLTLYTNSGNAKNELISVSQPAYGFIDHISSNAGTVRYHPPISYEGTDHFQARVKDSTGKISPLDYDVNVTPAIIETLQVIGDIEATITKDDTVTMNTSLLQGDQIYYSADNPTVLHNGRNSIQYLSLVLHPGIKVNNLDGLRFRLVVKGLPGSKGMGWANIRITGSARSHADILCLDDTKIDSPSTVSDGLFYEWKAKQPLFKNDFRHTAVSNGYGYGNDTSYNISIGGSFDLIDGVKVDNVYSSIQAFMPNLWWRFGLDGGFSQNRTNEPMQTSTRSDNYSPLATDPARASVNRYNAETNIRWDNLSLYCNPTFKITNGMYAFFNIEYRNTTRLSTTSFTFQKTDTIKTGPVRYDSTLSHQTDSTYKYSTDEIILGPGMLYEYEDNNIEFYFAPSFNFGYHGVPINILLEFKLTVLSSAVSIGGEVRNFLDGTGKNQYLIYLAKEFPMSFLTDLFGSGKK